MQQKLESYNRNIIDSGRIWTAGRPVENIYFRSTKAMLLTTDGIT